MSLTEKELYNICFWCNNTLLVIFLYWRVVGAVYRGALEKHWPLIAVRGFESLTLRKIYRVVVQLVEYLVWDQAVAGSSPVYPTAVP